MSILPFGTKLQWNFNQNKKLFFHENAFENIACEMAAILSRGDELRVEHLPTESSDALHILHLTLAHT